MIERLFFPPKVQRIRSSWLGPAIERYVEWMVERQYAQLSIDDRVPLLIRFGEFAWRRGARRVEDLPGHAETFVDHWVARTRRRGPHARRSAAQGARVCVEQMIQLTVSGFYGRSRPLEWPFIGAAPGYLTYLREERGLSPRTVVLHGHYLRKLESHLHGAGPSRLADLSPADLTAFVVKVAETVGPASMSVCVGAVRAFLRFAERERLVATNLARSVDRPRIYRLARVPRSISWADVQHLLKGVDRAHAIGKRDYAILLLLVTYGLRAREVAALALDDIDWPRARLRVPQRKGGHSHIYPLAVEVGDALVQYLREARPGSSDRLVFLQAKAPYTPLSFTDVGRRASEHLRRAGIDVPRPGSHTLRHTCVQRLVDGGFSLKAIGDFVGHRVPESTQIYAKVAIEALRYVAQDRGEGAL